MKISLVIATYEPNLQWLEKAVESIPVDLINEFILVDDCSLVPVPLDIVPEELRKKTKLVRNHANQGFWRSRNIGTEAAQGPWIATLDDDDILIPEGVQEAIRCYEHGGVFHPSIVTFPLLQMDKTGDLISPHHWPPKLEASLGQLYLGNRMCSGSWYHKELWKVLGGFQYDEAEDWDFWLRALWIGALVLWSTKPVYLHRVYPESKWSQSCKHIEKILHEVQTRFQMFKAQAIGIPRPFRPGRME